MGHDHRLYRADQVRELDRQAIEVHGIEGYALMNRAGAAVFSTLRARWPEARAITVCCGGGNNGGDGYVVARLCKEAGLNVQLVALKPPEELAGDAARAAADWAAVDGGTEGADERIRGDVIVDALLGTGLDREVRDDYAHLIGVINDTARPVLAIDVPSGLNSDTGMPMGHAVSAAVTVSFIGRKRGLYTGRAGDFSGDLVFTSLDTPEEIHDAVESDAELLDTHHLDACLPPRPASTHKGHLGHVLIAGGDFGMPGAVLLAARAALAAGSGLVSVATRREHALSLPAGQAEVMWRAVEDKDGLEAALERAGVIALGPGLGRSEWSRAVYSKLVADGRPLVLDADGLNLLVEQGGARSDWILTPHPGEAGRLLGTSTAEVQADRYAAVRTIAEKYRAVCVLKGHGSLVAAADGRVAVCPYGNPAMATAGMGDVLSGIAASFLGQGLGAFDAACAAVLLHALAGDRAARGRRQVIAGDVLAAIPDLLPA